MQKQTKQILVVIALLLVFGAAYGGMRIYNDRQEKQAGDRRTSQRSNGYTYQVARRQLLFGVILGSKVDLPQILPCMQFQFCFILPLCGRPQEQDCLLKIAVIDVDYLDYLLTDPFQHRLLPFPDLSNLFFTALMELFPCQASFYTKTKTACIRLNTPKVLTYR